MTEIPMNSASSNPLAEPRLWNQNAEAYSGSIAPNHARFAEDALRLAQVEAGMRIADVACGPGPLSLAAARRGATSTAIDFSPGMIAQLREAMRREGITQIDAREGNGMELPLADASCEAAFSMFGLIFFPDRHRGFQELLRVLVPGGRAVVSSWVPVERMPAMADIFRSLGELLPDLPFGGKQTPLGDAEEFRAEMADAGFREVEVHEVTHMIETPSIEEFWLTRERSAPPIQAVREAVGPERWAEVRQNLLNSLLAKWGTEPLRVAMIANLGVGRA
jgi:ubiquinone/menaquinone biosynthesis C-methylase UbiE